MGWPILVLLLWLSPFSSFALAESLTLTDQAGRTVTVPAHPRRVVALAPSVTEIAFAVGRGDRIVGVTQFSDYPPEARNLPQIGSYVQPSLEGIASLAPDLCVAVKDGNPIDIVRRIEGLGIPVYGVDPRGLESVMDAIHRIGDLLEARDRAESLVNDMKTRIERVRNAAVRATDQPRVFFQIGVSPIVAVGTATFLHELIVTAGGRNVSEGNTPYPRFSREQVLALAPEVIIVTSMTRGQIFEEVKREWERWPGLPAVKSGRVHLVNSDLYDRPGPRMVDGLEELFRLIHPELAGTAAK